MKNNYIEAVLEMIEAGKESKEVLAGLKKTLATRGHERLYAPVLRGVARVLESKEAAAVEVVVAKEADAKAFATAINEALQELSITEKPTVTVDETVIGGFVVEGRTQRFDASYKTKLVQLYRKITNY